MKPRNLLIAAGLLVALSGFVWYAKRHPETSSTPSSTSASPKVTDIPAAQIKSLSLERRDAQPVTVSHEGGKWSVTAPDKYSADQDSVNSLVSSLNPVTADNVVDDKASDLSKFGLTKPSFTVVVHETSGKSTSLAFGDDIPAGSLVYAHLNGDSKVYAIASSVKTGLDKTANDLRDKRLLTIDTNSVTSVDVVSPKSTVEFAKNNANEWQIVKPQPFRAESFQVEELLRKLTEAKMDTGGTPDDAKKVEAGFAAGTNVGQAKIAAGSGTQTLDVHKSKDDYYAKSSVVKGTFKVSSDLGKQLEKPAEEYRNKKIYDFGFSDPSKLILGGSLGERTLTRSGTDWKSGSQTMDAGAVQSFIDKARDLAATKFATASFTAPALTLAVTSNDGKRNEKAEFAKSADGYIGRRENEPALYQLDAKAVDDLVTAGRAIKPATSAKK